MSTDKDQHDDLTVHLLGNIIETTVTIHLRKVWPSASKIGTCVLTLYSLLVSTDNYQHNDQFRGPAGHWLIIFYPICISSCLSLFSWNLSHPSCRGGIHWDLYRSNSLRTSQSTFPMLEDIGEKELLLQRDHKVYSMKVKVIRENLSTQRPPPL